MTYTVELRPYLWVTKEIEAPTAVEASEKMYQLYRSGALQDEPMNSSPKDCYISVQNPETEEWELIRE